MACWIASTTYNVVYRTNHRKNVIEGVDIAMYKIDNTQMLEFFQADNEIKHYEDCLNIVNAGKERHGIKSVEYYTSEKNTPKLEYVEFTADIFGGLSVKTNTTDAKLLEATSKKIIEIYEAYSRIAIETPSSMDLSVNGTILEYFDLSNIFVSKIVVYGLLAADKVPSLEIPEGVDIRVATADEIQMIKGLDNREWCGMPMMLNRVYNQETDLLFLLYFGNQLAGALCANSRYRNIYSIMMGFVHERYRGRNLGTLLTMYFAHHCLNNGLYPHYGTAASTYSENVAINSGFEETSRSHGFDITPRQG
jgi:GNAT superfamily N-acetyltransferase